MVKNAPKAGKGTAVAKVTAVTKAAPTEMELQDELAEMEGMGLEEVKASDLIIPRITILQALSPQLQKSKPEFIKGATAGQICDLSLSKLFDEITFIPVHYKKNYIEWAPRNSGKGLVKIHDDPRILDMCTRNDRNQPIMPNKNYIQETAQFFGFNVSDSFRRVFIPMASTQLKKAKKWLTMATEEKMPLRDGRMITPPLFFRSYNLSVGEESNSEGEWFGWRIEPADTVQQVCESAEIDLRTFMEQAKEFHNYCATGQAKADLASMAADAATEEGSM